jgi:hypothetical protein
LRLQKLNDRLAAIQAQVAGSPRRPSVDTVQKRIDAALAKAGPPARMWVVTPTVTETPQGPTCSSDINYALCETWGHTHWGNTNLFTDRHDWTTEQIVTAYRDARHIEQTFHNMKQAPWLLWQPQFHWTDSKIRVHAFIGVLSVTLVHLLRRECARGGTLRHLNLHSRSALSLCPRQPSGLVRHPHRARSASTATTGPLGDSGNFCQISI